MANTTFKTENGLLVIGETILTGDVSITNTSAVLTTTNLNPTSNTGKLGNTSARWVITANTGSFSGPVDVSSNLVINTSAFVVTTNTTSNRVGINTATPDSALTVVGSANVSQAGYFGTTITSVGSALFGNNVFYAEANNGVVRINTTDVSNTSNKLAVAGNTYVGGDAVISGQITAASMYLTGDLQVSGNLTYTGTADGDIVPNSNTQALGSPTDATKRWRVYASMAQIDNNLTVGGTVSVANATTTHAILGNVAFDINTLYIDAANNRVGISNSTPDASLTITGTANVSGNVAVGGTLTVAGNTTLNGSIQTVAGNVNFDSGTLFVDSVNNRVGINNTAPTVAFVVTGSAAVSGPTTFSNTVTIAGNTRIGNTTSFILMKTSGALQVSKELEIGNTSLYSNSAVITTALTNTAIDVFLTDEYRTSKYLIDYHSTSNSAIFGAVEMLVLHNNTGVVISSEYGAVFSANINFSLDASIPAGTNNCTLYASADQGNLAIDITRISMA